MLFKMPTGRMETDRSNNGSRVKGRQPIIYAVGVIETVDFSRHKPHTVPGQLFL